MTRRNYRAASIALLLSGSIVLCTAAAQELELVSEATFGGPGTERAVSAARHPNGDFYVAVQDGAVGTDMHLMRVSAAGDSVWTVNIGIAGSDEPNGIAILRDGTIVVVGSVSGDGYRFDDVVIVRVDEDGGVLFEETYASDELGSDESANCVASTGDGGYIVGYTVYYPGSGQDGYFGSIQKRSRRNDIEWRRSPDYLQTTFACRAIAGGFVVTGSHWLAIGQPLPIGILLTLDDRGFAKMETYFGVQGHDSYMVDICGIAGGRVYASGYSQSHATGGQDALYGSVRLNGSDERSGTYGEHPSEIAYACAIVRDGMTVGAGSRYKPGARYEDAFVHLVDPDGEVIDALDLGGEWMDYLYDAVLVSPDSVFLFGYTHSEESGSDVYMVHAAVRGLPVSTESQVGKVPDKQEPPHPNPFSASVSIPIHQKESGYVVVEAFDSIGRRVGIITKGRFPAGDHVATWEPVELQSGAYYIRITSQHANVSHTVLYLR